MSFISATKIGKEIGMSYQKVNNVLGEYGFYDKKTRQPTKHAIESGLAKIKSTVSRFSGEYVEYTAWDFSRLAKILPQSTKHEKAIKCRSSMDAHDRICEAFSDFGAMLEIEPRIQKQGISAEAHYAVVQAYFCDPDYLKGTMLFHRFFRSEEAEAVKAITLRLAHELFVAANKIDAKRAQSNLRTTEIVLQWLCDKAK